MPEIDRRELLTRAGQLAAGACLGCGVAGAGPDPVLGSPAEGRAARREVDFYHQLSDDRIQCFVCPLHCELDDGETCFCRTRTNYGGRLYSDAYANPCIIATDPIEKLPLNHFLPGTRALTVAVGGCNLRCLYCQNWQQSQVCPNDIKTFKLAPADAVDLAVKKGLPTIAFGYTEPVAFLEYARDVAVPARKRGLRVVAATAAFDDELYHRMTGTRLEPVKAAIEALHKRTKCWLEIVYLVVPTYNDDPAMIRAMCRWLRQAVGTQVPLHFARFVPMYKLKDLPSTPPRTLEASVEIARSAGLRCVYTSNIAPHKDTDTRCLKCGATLIQRLGFKVLEDRARGGRCPRCRAPQPGVWR